MPSPDQQSVIVTLSGTRPAGEVAPELSKEGLAVRQVLDAIGVITGWAHPDAIAALRSHPGVADVSEDHRVDIGPPGAPIS